MPEPRPVTRRIDESAADMGSLVDLGIVEEQPVPEPPPEVLQEPVEPDPPDDAA